jgi:hypothetical protein
MYMATIARNSPNSGGISVSLTGADFVTEANQFAGIVDPSGGIMFSLGISDIFYEFFVNDVEERLGAGTLVISGMATTTASPERISGALVGTLGIVADAGAYPRSYVAECTSDAHALEMVRR